MDNKRVRGSPIEDLKLRREEGKGGSQSIYLRTYYKSYFKLTPLLTVRSHLTSRATRDKHYIIQFIILD